ncbi:polymer-forming cytoskeletal protein [Paraburkholderia fungorum]|uniref:polymer-forming cytoskeletal protein n=1 Tax=Paraburkholderia fungorum TaxID=134537 RepID=UPI0004849913|nr:polymer-forming cytoskeletal protein [Paraburkholderia fungorum]PNE59645.1 polymer-forming cytoskeletal protein [Paraburkholderia fungorum]
MQNAAQQHDEVDTGAAVSYLDKFRATDQPQTEQQQAPTRARSRTPLPNLRTMFDRLINNFGRDSDGVFYLDHEKHNIRSTFSGDFELDGTIKTRAGALFKGTMHSPESLIKSGGTVVIDADADVSINIECETLIVLGKHSGKATVKGTLINMGAIKGEYMYGALESFGRIEGMVEQIVS